MNQDQAKELHLLFFSFMGIFHKKFLRKLRKERHSSPRLSKNQAKIVHILYQFNSLNFTELGKMLDIEKGGLTTMIDQLEELDMVARTPDPDDRRKYRLSLSVLGMEYMNRIMERYTLSLMNTFEGIDDRELTEFIANLRQVVQFMERL